MAEYIATFNSYLAMAGVEFFVRPTIKRRRNKVKLTRSRSIAIALALFIALLLGVVPKNGHTQTSNLVGNPSLEVSTQAVGIPDGWFQGGWGNNDRRLTYPVPGHSGNAAQVTITQYGDGDAKWYPGNILVQAGATYTFSDWYTSTAPSLLVVQYSDANGNPIGYDGFIEVPTSSIWRQTTMTFTPPPVASSFTVFHLLQSVGTLTVDDYFVGTGTGTQALVAVVLDDGWKSALTADAIAQNYKVPLSYAIIAGQIGAQNRLSSDEIYGLFSRGGEIVGHSWSHVGLSAYTDYANLVYEMILSKIQIGKAVGSLGTSIGTENIQTFAYPLGSYSGLSTDVAKAGYIAARTSDPGYNDATTDRFLLKSQAIDRTNAEFASFNGDAVAMFTSWITYAKANGKFLIILLHQVDNNPAATLRTTPTEFDGLMRAIASSGIKPVTMTQGVRTTYKLL